MPNSPAVTSKRPREEGERLPLEFFLHFFLSRTRARQEVFVFILHLFTRVRQLLDSKKDRGEGFVRKRGDFLHFLGVYAQFSVDIQGSMVERSVNLSVTDDLMKSVKVNEVRELLFKQCNINN